jgi:hypothetical protein
MKATNKKNPASSSDKQKGTSTGLSEFAFGKQNYKLLLIGLVLILLGFLLMIGGGSDDPNVFSDKMFDFRRLTLAPILVLAGYVVEIFAIMKKPKE